MLMDLSWMEASFLKDALGIMETASLLLPSQKSMLGKLEIKLDEVKRKIEQEEDK